MKGYLCGEMKGSDSLDYPGRKIVRDSILMSSTAAHPLKRRLSFKRQPPFSNRHRARPSPHEPRHEAVRNLHGSCHGVRLGVHHEWYHGSRRATTMEPAMPATRGSPRSQALSLPWSHVGSPTQSTVSFRRRWVHAKVIDDEVLPVVCVCCGANGQIDIEYVGSEMVSDAENGRGISVLETWLKFCGWLICYSNSIHVLSKAPLVLHFSKPKIEQQKFLVQGVHYAVHNSLLTAKCGYPPLILIAKCTLHSCIIMRQSSPKELWPKTLSENINIIDYYWLIPSHNFITFPTFNSLNEWVAFPSNSDQILEFSESCNWGMAKHTSSVTTT